MSDPGGYQRTRIVLQLSAGLESPHALEAAVRLAQALRSDLTGVFVEREDLISAACLPFAREVSYTGQRLPLSRDSIERRMRVQAERLRQHMERLAMAAHVRTQYDVVRAEIVGALRNVAKDARILALSQTALDTCGVALKDVMAQFPDVEGFLIAGPRARRGAGPVVAVVETIDDARNVIPLADDIARASSAPLTVIVCGTDHALVSVAQQAAQMLPRGQAGIQILRAPHPDARLLANAVHNLRAGLLVSHVGSPLLAGDHNSAVLTNLLECPVLIKQQPPTEGDNGQETPAPRGP